MKLRTRIGRRPLIVSAIAVCLLAIGAIVVRFTGDGGSADSAPRPAPPPSTTASTAAGSNPATGTNEPAPTIPATSTTPPAEGGVGDVEVPIDPSGARSMQSESGALQSAVDYLSTVRQRLVYLNEEAGRQVLSDWAAPGVADAAIDTELQQAAMLRNGLSADGGDVWWIVSPLASRVEAYSGDRAVVSVWLSSVIGAGADPEVSNEATQPMSRFQTDTVDLVWADGRWMVWSISSVEGPTPMTAPSSGIATAESFIVSMDGFSLIRRHQQ